MGDLSSPTNAGIPKKRNKGKEKPPADINALFQREDEIIALWGRPYDGPVKNTKLKEQ